MTQHLANGSNERLVTSLQLEVHTSYVLGAFTKHAALCVDIDIHNINRYSCCDSVEPKFTFQLVTGQSSPVSPWMKRRWSNFIWKMVDLQRQLCKIHSENLERSRSCTCQSPLHIRILVDLYLTKIRIRDPAKMFQFQPGILPKFSKIIKN